MNSISLKSYYHIHALLKKSIRPDVLKKCEAGNTLLSNTAPYRCSFKSLGWIRLLAYRRAKPIAKYLGKKDTTYMYIVHSDRIIHRWWGIERLIIDSF